jgi:hypothetical protein
MNKYSIFALILVTLLACQNTERRRQKIVENKIEEFNKSRYEGNILTKQLLTNDYILSNLGKSISPESLPKEVSNELNKKGIFRIAISKRGECIEVEYGTNWTKYPIGQLYLTWSSCEKIETKKGYYENNSNFIEIWGIGDGWSIWTDCDFI